MKQIVETFLRIILLVVVLYTTSFAAFAGNKDKQARKAKKKAPVVAAISAPRLEDAPDQKEAKTQQLTPQLKRKHKVAIVPAPPPGQIPTYVPPKR